MGNTEKLLNQIMELKFTSKSLQRQARKCEKEEKAEKLKVKKAIEKGNMDGARIYAENAIRKRTEQMNYLRLSSRLDAVVARLDTQAKMTTINKSMANIVKSLESSLATGNLQKMSETMDQFEKQFVNMEVQAEFMESAMAGSTSLSTPEGEVNSLMQQVADDYGLEVSVGLPQAAAHAIPTKAQEKNFVVNVDEEISCCLRASYSFLHRVSVFHGEALLPRRSPIASTAPLRLSPSVPPPRSASVCLSSVCSCATSRSPSSDRAGETPSPAPVLRPATEPSQIVLKWQSGTNNDISWILATFLIEQNGCLLQVVVMTHAYGNRSGVRYMTGGLKVYYVPWKPFVMQNTLPTFYGTLPIIRTILIREKVSLVHGHQAFSTLCHEALMHARTMGYKVVFTDHSLYGFADVGSVHMNKVLQFTLADVSQAICVSHTSKENTVLRSGLPPEKVYVIPNAVDTAMFKPAPVRPSNNEIVIVVISRLVYRKGADLLVEVIPKICCLYPNVRFVIGGDGPKRVRLEEMREKHSIQDRVEMLGAVPHSRVRSVLISGHIFLNSSLTEAFCIAILEAASCGLLTVSTRVGGVPEASPDPDDMVQAIKKAISLLPKIDPQVMHNRMKKLYDWHDVAKRTEIVYDRALKCPNQNVLERLSRYLSCGAWAGKLFCLVMIIDFLLWRLLQLWQPDADIEEVPEFIVPYQEEEASSSCRSEC
ncbi:hypothetical protein Tsubulata_005646 [Turnera subulata]|uniref:phosphatidylinositol N-acetylglucosaminyltransferase n=1 Tax=Turnera subulata TaxID=218843 RepID=A0A9Q0J0R7_9ROSI|nr:hypothetical protein Tsubulata_005646 [Turnera subulata]